MAVQPTDLYDGFETQHFYICFLSRQVGGIVVMAVGIWTCVDHAYMEQLLGTNLYMSAAYILIATGVVVILISFLGCLGAVKEIKCMLLTVRFSRYAIQPILAAAMAITLKLVVFLLVFHSYVRYLCDDAGRRYFGICIPRERCCFNEDANVLFSRRIRR